jgi:thymidylate synthase (FAD)
MTIEQPIYYRALDHGFCALIDCMGDDRAIDSAARNSVGGVFEHRGDAEIERLIDRLMRDEHTSPFEMVELKFHCAMPIFVARQWIRHRTANVNEFSGRYSVMPALFYQPSPEVICHQSEKNKQGRGKVVDAALAQLVLKECECLNRGARSSYEWMLEHDISRELARVELPLSTYTQWYWKIDLHNLLRFLRLRLHPDAQYEIRVFARIMGAIVADLFPATWRAFSNHILNSVRLSDSAVAAVLASDERSAYNYIFKMLTERIVIDVPDLLELNQVSVNVIRKEWGR